MNRFVGVGVLTKDAVLNGAERNVMKFTLETYLGQSKKTGNPRKSYVPCVIFNPSADMVKLLGSGTRGCMFGLEGRVNTFTFEANGEKRYSTEVVVDEWSLRLLDVKYEEYKTTASPEEKAA